ncbi:biotin transporter BioY [Paenibacillus gorillae]|uniref:biotin transporter BioY n=1 Tax=Paenibacillus gorillae TaxID=1243662 RepID=UPI0004B4D77D|nr:biotin transporter BioY [Paenibacillus gorillae]
MRSTSNVRNLVFIALFAALFIAMSSIELRLGLPVPITLQTLALTLAGAFLGPRNGFFAILIVLALTATGLPLLHGKGGISYLVGATGGFLFIFPFCAMLIGFATRFIFNNDKLRTNRTLTFIALFIAFELFGSLISYVAGVPWLMQVTGLSFQKAMAAGCYPFLLGDVIKAFAAAVITLSLKPYILRIQSSMKGKSLQSAFNSNL